MNRYKLAAAGILAGLLLGSGCGMLGIGQGKKLTHGPQVGHMVFFTLKDNSIYEKQKLVRDCYAYLRNQPGPPGGRSRTPASSGRGICSRPGPGAAS